MRALALCIALAAPAALLAHSDATGIVKERMDAMKDIADATKAIAEMLEGKRTYDPTQIRQLSTRIGNHGEALVGLFPGGSLDHPSEALPAIWTAPGEFAALAERLTTSATELTAAGDRAQTEAAFNELAKTCKSCHEQFRQKKD